MKKIKVMIAEDEWLARKELRFLLEQEEDLELLPDASNGTELLEFVDKWEPNIIFMDIHMPELDGMGAARLLQSAASQALIAFTTAHDDYAVEAFGLNAVDYLLKPYSHERLKETLTRIRKNLVTQDAQAGGVVSKKSLSTLKTGKWSKLLITDGEKHVLLDPETILYAEIEEKTTHIYTSSQQAYTTKMSLNDLEHKLAEYPFFRPHRSFLVNLNQIEEIVPWFNGAFNIILKHDKRAQIPVSREMAKELFRLLKEG
ncbi:LytTR family DNA-binding domain-containing protein [Paenibacillus sp. N1-5-1-14]|uniref:LytR/AlgR family response regulator transcription factor n=1 Tax=Paenibacillus radicibacter TaxID=2972488 RepID=UPI00215964C4|nr:LytTR family DNA-binding domain-containing protein [Paenibacillus radicibacter]MCR8641225.1 LytTR family DNA-binding domain-containing protein [Paenibacillus radicibacter]